MFGFRLPYLLSLSMMALAAIGRAEKITIHPGEEWTNTDGAHVESVDPPGSPSGADATMNPKFGTSQSATTIDTKTGFSGNIDGIDANDTVNIGSSNKDVTVSSSEGGTVNIGGTPDNVVVANTAPEGGADIIIVIAGHREVLHPGNSVTFDDVP